MLAGAAAAGGQERGAAPVKACHPAVGLGVAGLDQAVIDGVGSAAPLAGVLAGRRAFAGGAAPVGNRLAGGG